ncbi:molecular chaperone DnaJ [Marinobacter sp. X15-166B]|uniref:molecular chaperone DnaJ n=1 Tax=Marinobacter sp. X15-166B TaxID=1897620 RepID=UPI00085BC5F0|nr:molecular chaperone DnaJ [Marinobacter sp. X15-166B]OEY65707.1 molecular chaperone DnaJ [Marinobacter sp. X15-166B]
MHWILGIGLTILVFVVLKRWGSLTAEQRKRTVWQTGLAIAGGALLIMVLTGRVHVLTAGVAALLPLLRKLPALLRHWPTLSRLLGQGNAGAHREQSPAQTAAGMPVPEACEILGVDAGCSDAEVVAAHRRLIQKLHPDRGGNTYLAARVNEARDVLLGRTG